MSDSYPSTIDFNDPENSWEAFKMLEAHKDSLGSWRVIDVLGKPVVELPEALHEDLLTWRWLSDIARRMKDKRDNPQPR